MIRQASDLMSKYVGETEQQMAAIPATPSPSRPCRRARRGRQLPALDRRSAASLRGQRSRTRCCKAWSGSLAACSSARPICSTSSTSLRCGGSASRFGSPLTAAQREAACRRGVSPGAPGCAERRRARSVGLPDRFCSWRLLQPCKAWPTSSAPPSAQRNSSTTEAEHRIRTPRCAKPRHGLRALKDGGGPVCVSFLAANSGSVLAPTRSGASAHMSS